MVATDMVLPDDFDEDGYDDREEEEEDDDLETGSRRRDPWEKDKYTGVC